jgi:cytidylate kinase
LVAERLGYTYFDTGVLYRAVTRAALDRGVSLQDEAAVTQVAQALTIDVLPPATEDGRQYTVMVDGEDVTWDIRKPDVERSVSAVSAYPGVRSAMLAQQRRIADRGHIVMVGRDIGTVVLPQADLKVYLDAPAEERARRRWQEEQARGGSRPYEDLLADVRRRDAIDSSRQVAPLKPAADAIIVDTSAMTVDDVVDHVCDLIEAQESVFRQWAADAEP